MPWTPKSAIEFIGETETGKIYEQKAILISDNIEQRKQIVRQLKLSPSLKPYLSEAVQEAYADAVDLAVKETGLPDTAFPGACPYPIEQLLDDVFYPR